MANDVEIKRPGAYTIVETTEGASAEGGAAAPTPPPRDPYLRADGSIPLEGNLYVDPDITIDDRDISADGLILDNHLNSGGNKHDASEIDVEGIYLEIPGTPTDLEGTIASINVALTNALRTPQQIQDAIGAILTDTASIDLTYNGVLHQIYGDIIPGGIDHGQLAGLGDDDHPQYLRADGVRQLSGNLSVAVGATIDGRDISADGLILDAHIADSSIHHTSEQIQDIIGLILTDTATIDLIYEDVFNQIKANVIPGGIDHGTLGNLGGDAHLQYLRADGGRTLTGNMAVDPGITIDGRDISVDGATLDSHVTGGPNAHDADQVDIEGSYANIPGTPCDVETAMGGINSLFSALGNNWISNGDAETSTAGWSRYVDDNLSGTRFIPYDGTGGSPSGNVTWTRTAVSPLTGTGSFLLTKDAANRQGEGVSCDFTIPKTLSSQINLLTFDYVIDSGTYATNDVRLFIYDVDNGIIILPQVNIGIGIGNGRFTGFFTGHSNATNYRLIFHISSASASAYTVKIDNIRVYYDEGIYKHDSGRVILEANLSGHATPRDVCYRPTSDRLYVSNSAGAVNSRVRTVNPTLGTVETAITAQTDPYGICYCQSNDRVYACNYGSNSVSKIYGTSVELNIAVGTNPYRIVYCPTNDKLYVANYDTNTISVINVPDSTVTSIIVGNGVRDVMYCPTNDRIYVTNGTDDTLSVIRPSDNVVVDTISVADTPYILLYCNLNNRIYISHYTPNTVSVLNPENNIIETSITVGTNPSFLAYNPANYKLYVVNITSDNVSVIHVPSSMLLGNVTVGDNPGGLVYCPMTDKIYVCNATSGTLSILGFF